MDGLTKATLQEIGTGRDAKPIGDPVPVQFNPSSLRLQLQNQTEGGRSKSRPTQQFLGNSSTTLTMELVFDSADEGTTAAPSSVRLKTAMVEKFVVPKSQSGKKQAPPRVRFHWGDLKLDGIIQDLNIDFDLFSAGGVPLRAKMNVTIKEQDPQYEYLGSGAGANTAGNAPPAGSAGGPATPGSQGNGLAGGGGAAAGGGGQPGAGLAPPGSRTAQALGGESAAEFAARQGLDPAAWRAVAAQVPNSLSLPAGAQVAFDETLSASAGLGATTGVEAGASASVEASFGLEAQGAQAPPGPFGSTGEAARGFALSAAGGPTAAIQAVQQARVSAAADTERRAFAAALPPSAQAAGPGAAPPPRPGPPVQARPRLADTGLPTPAAQAAAPPAPTPPRPDPRALTFGFGVPLRPTRGGAASERASTLAGGVALRPRPVDTGNVPLDPTVPPWTQLPPAAPAPTGAAGAHGQGCSCGCASRRQAAPRQPRPPLVPIPPARAPVVRIPLSAPTPAMSTPAPAPAPRRASSPGSGCCGGRK